MNYESQEEHDHFKGTMKLTEEQKQEALQEFSAKGGKKSAEAQRAKYKDYPAEMARRGRIGAEKRWNKSGDK